MDITLFPIETVAHRSLIGPVLFSSDTADFAVLKRLGSPKLDVWSVVKHLRFDQKDQIEELELPSLVKLLARLFEMRPPQHFTSFRIAMDVGRCLHHAHELFDPTVPAFEASFPLRLLHPSFEQFLLPLRGGGLKCKPYSWHRSSPSANIHHNALEQSLSTWKQHLNAQKR